MIDRAQSRVWHYLAWDTANNKPFPGDAANHTIQTVTDGIIAPATNGPANMSILNSILFTADEMDGNSVALAGVSSTPDVAIIPVIVITSEKTIGIDLFIPFSVWNNLTNQPQPGALARLNMEFAAEGVNGAINAAALVELSAANAPGLYGATLLGATQNTAQFMSVFGFSSDPNENVLPINYATDPGRSIAINKLPLKVIRQEGVRLIRRKG